MLEMLLIMTGVGATATIAIVVAGLEWRALFGYWRGSRGKHP
jgi:hypothetical protein